MLDGVQKLSGNRAATVHRGDVMKPNRDRQQQVLFQEVADLGLDVRQLRHREAGPTELVRRVEPPLPEASPNPVPAVSAKNIEPV